LQSALFRIASKILSAKIRNKLLMKKPAIYLICLFVVIPLNFIIDRAYGQNIEPQDLLKSCMSDEADYHMRAKIVGVANKKPPLVREAFLSFVETFRTSGPAKTRVCEAIVQAAVRAPKSFAKRLAGDRNGAELFSELAIEAGVDVAIRYFKNLRGDEIKPFFAYVSEMHRSIARNLKSTRWSLCEGLFNGQIQNTRDKKLLRTVENKIPPPVQASYWLMLGKAFGRSSGSNHDRAIQSFSPEETTQIEEKFGAYLGKKVEENFGEEGIREFSNIILKKEEKYPLKNCAWGIIYYDALASMDGWWGDKTREYFVYKNF
jgi:hypothetical protein